MVAVSSVHFKHIRHQDHKEVLWTADIVVTGRGWGGGEAVAGEVTRDIDTRIDSDKKYLSKFF